MPPTPAVPQPVPMPGVPFDRVFFEQVLPGAVQAFFAQTKCAQPVVEVLTVDGATHYVRGISGLSDAWVALHTNVPEHEQDIEVFIPYQTIFRVAVHPCDDEKRRLGFVIQPAKQAVEPKAERAVPEAVGGEAPELVEAVSQKT